MATCTNCGRTISCGCQRRTASNGQSVCSSCSQEYEEKLSSKSFSTIRTNYLESETLKNDPKNLTRFIKK
jgi:hypothetical protein